MRIAQEFKAGSTIKIGNDVLLVLKSEFSKSGRNAAVVKFKFKNLITGQISETVMKAADKIDEVRLDRRVMQYLYNDGEQYHFMDQENYEQIGLTDNDLGDSVNFLKEEMNIDVLLYEGRPVGVELPNHVDREVTYTEPGLRGDTTGNVTKPATIEGGYELQVPIFINISESIKIDTRTGLYLERTK